MIKEREIKSKKVSFKIKNEEESFRNFMQIEYDFETMNSNNNINIIKCIKIIIMHNEINFKKIKIVEK